MKPTNLYYPNGCTVCKGEVSFDETNFEYLCLSCGASARAHREDSNYARKNEPYQYLAGSLINSLRRQLSVLSNFLWHTKYNFHREGKTNKESLINIINPINTKQIELNDELAYVQTIHLDTRSAKCTVMDVETNTVYIVCKNELKPVSNRQKAFIWLAKEMNIPIGSCQIGYMSKEQLQKAIELCHDAIIEARHIAKQSINKSSINLKS